MTMAEQKPARSDSGMNLGFLTGLFRQFRLVWLLMQDSRVPLWMKSVVPLSLLYLISPLDFIPDVALGFGQLDDLGVILLGMALFVKLCPQNIVEYYQNQLEYGPEDDRETVDASYRVMDEE
ncbi:MAG: DUF1232 domain-containing protein [Chloroflexi bacterium]|nr:DUF1232 domain-containing protein [Chloroflexota bacterium]